MPDDNVAAIDLKKLNAAWDSVKDAYPQIYKEEFERMKRAQELIKAAKANRPLLARLLGRARVSGG